ncbi:succinate dehydrogenase 5 [Striga asiatica]|uniref:Succinate dehydrogenase 5 n=1 Tax=Striga asiatica TaxID=4170 RepID=A0A5A7P3I5_STRAF|nr:succinate dehydrogenase 5 [Striga asiatica]
MEKMVLMRSLCRSIIRRSQHFSSAGAAFNRRIHHLHFSPPSLPASFRNRPFYNLAHCKDCVRNNDQCGVDVMHPFAMCTGSTRFFSEDVTHMPVIKDQEIERAFKDLMATNWDELSPAIVHDVKNALSKNTEDKAAQDVLKNVFRAAEAVEEFTGIIMSLKMELDDVIGLSGENVKPLTEEYSKALQTIFDRYAVYLAAFGPEETYLKKKVETELGTKMIYLKMRCGGLDAEWGKVTVLATSGLSGSYVEKRA